MKKVLLTLYTCYFATLFIGLMLAFLPLFLISALFGRRTNLVLATVWMQIWFRATCFFSGIRLRTLGKQHTRGQQPCVYVGNHNSFLDVFAIKPAVGGGFFPLAKKEQEKTPVMGWIYKLNVIGVDRSSEASRARAMQTMRHRMLDEGYSILILPEGTMNRTEHILKSFYDGAFRLAIETQRPVCPFVVINARRLMPRGSLLVRPGTLTTIFLPPIATTGLTTADVPMLKQQVWEAMYAALVQHSPAGTIGLGAPKPIFN